jgi:serine/threonine protein kinase
MAWYRDCHQETSVWQHGREAHQRVLPRSRDHEVCRASSGCHASCVAQVSNTCLRLRSLRHPNVLQYLGSAYAPSGREVCICMEYMPLGSLYRLLHNAAYEFSLARIKSICIDTARGINYLHNQSPPIIHRDLKVCCCSVVVRLLHNEQVVVCVSHVCNATTAISIVPVAQSHNLLVDEHWRVKVCDFGLSRFIAQNATMTACGTPSWTAPEVLRNEKYTTKADVYGYGIVLWELFARQDPFPGMSN